MQQSNRKHKFIALCKKKWTIAREFIWPLLEKASDASKSQKTFEINVEDDCLEFVLQQKSKILEAEEDRRKSIESKASLFINSLSIASSLVLAASTLVLNNNFQSNRLFITLSVTATFTLALYTVRTIWFAVKALERGVYSVLSIDDINKPGEINQLRRELLHSYRRIKINNQELINQKVINVTMAQEYYKRAIAIICIYAFFLLIFCIFR